MKRYLITVLVLLILSSNLLSTLDMDEENKILDKLEELKSITGVLVTGRGKVFFGAYKGSNGDFTNYNKVKDYKQVIQLDLDFSAQPLNSLKFAGILRFENDISGYWGTGNILSVRDIYAEMILLRFIEIRAGTLYEKFTPFTLYAPVEIAPLDAPLLKIYKDIQLYDNYLDKYPKFPLEGFRIKSGLMAPDLLSINLVGMAVKLDDSSSAGNSFDRFLFAGHGNCLALNAVYISGTYISIQDLEDTGEPLFNQPLKNNITSGEAKLDIIPFLFSEKFIIKSFGGEVEIAKSSFNSNTSTNIVKPVEGYANQIAGFINLMDILEAKAGFRAIDYEFVSPGAQTRMTTPLFDRDYFEDLNLHNFYFDYSYRNKVMMTRDNQDWLNLTYPMNTATPNRIGLFSQINAHYRTFLTAKIEIHQMEELRPVAASNNNKRSFSRTVRSAKIDTSKMLTDFIPALLPKIVYGFFPEIEGFYITERTQRDDDPETTSETANIAATLFEKEDYKVNIIGYSIIITPLKKLSLAGLYQKYRTEGRHILDGYVSHQPLLIAGYKVYFTKEENELYGTGLIYKLEKASRIHIDYMIKEMRFINPYTDKIYYNHNINSLRALLLAKF